MSSLLRGTRLLKNNLSRITNVARPRGYNISITPFAPCTFQGATRNLSADATVESTHQQANAGQAVSKLTEVERRLELMDSNVRWRGRIDREEVEGVLTVLKKEGELSEQQALMLLRCSGSLMVKESPDQRMIIFNKIWDTLNDLGVNLKTVHYNSALRVQIENQHNFIASDILSEMESTESKKPNRVTFQLLIARYCEDGDIDGATKILQFMKTENLPINETVFNSLIKGHLKKGDVEGAKGIIASMRSSGLEPSSDTYRSILCCHAENGDMAAIQQTFEDAQKDEVHLSPSQIYSALLVLVDSGHGQLVEQLMTYIRPGANHDTMNCAHQLIARGHDDEALKVYTQLMQQEDVSDAAISGARAFIRTMVLNNKPIEKLKSVMNVLKSHGRLQNDDASLLAFFGINYERNQIAVDAIKEMKAEGLPVRPHFFWPLFIRYHKNKEDEGLFNAVSVMADCAEHNEDYIPSLYRKVFVPQVMRTQDPTAIVTRFKESGVETEDVNTVQLLHLMNNGDVTEAQQFIESSPFSFHVEELKFAVVAAAAKSKDISAVCQIVKGLQGVYTGNTGIFNGDLLNNLLNQKGITSEERLKVAEEWTQQELILGPLSAERAKTILTSAGAPESLLEKVGAMALPSRRSKALDRSEAVSMTEEDLERELKARKPNDRDLNLIRKQLLMKYCTNGRIEKADAMRAKLEDAGFMFDATTLRQLAFLAAHFKKDLEEALKFKQQLEVNHPDFSNYTKVVFDIATLQAKKGDFEGARTSLLKHTEAQGERWKEGNFSASYEMVQNVQLLMDEYKKEAQPSQILDLVQTLFEHGFVKPGIFSVMQDVVRAYLDKEDFDGLMEVLEKYHQDYNRVPLYSAVFRALIKKEDAERLQKVVDMVTSLDGEMPVLHQLILAFIDCGQVKKARKIVETPGLRASMPVLKPGVDQYVQKNKEEELRQLIDITKNLFAIDHDEMLFGLIRLKANKKDTSVDAFMDVLAMYEEQGIKPRARTLRYLAKVLQSHGHEVPFEVPTISNKTATPLKGSSSLEAEAIKAVRAGEVQTVCNILKTRSAEKPVSTEFICEIATHIAKDLGPAQFKRLIYSLGEEDDQASLQAVLQSADTNVNLIRFTKQQLFQSQLRGGQAEETMQQIEEQPSLVNDYISPRVFKVMVEKQPEFLPRVEAAVERQLAEKPEGILAANCLFDHWVRAGQQDKAESLWKSNENYRMKARLMDLATEFREQKNEEGLRWLLGLTKDVSPSKQSLVYSQLIAVKNAASDVQGALGVTQEARDAGLEYSNLWGAAMKQLEVQLLAGNQQPPWEVGIFDQKRGRVQRQAQSTDADQTTQRSS